MWFLPMPRKHVKIDSKNYGKRWRNFKIYYLGSRPRGLSERGFTSGKTILETLAARFKKFELILCDGKSRIRKEGKTTQVFLSTDDLRQVNSQLFTRKKDVTQAAFNAKFGSLFPEHFDTKTRLFSYERGLLAGVLTKTLLPTRLSKEDQRALADYIPGFIASGVAKGAGAGKSIAGLEIKILQETAKELEQRIATDKAEATWQAYLKEKITLIQQGYIELIPKGNIDLIGTQYPDFLLVTHDGYLDILEIKTPFTTLLLEDRSHKNYYWSGELSKAIAQIENYIDAVVNMGDHIRARVKDRFQIELRVIRPRGIIFAGNSKQFGEDALIRDDFRLLNEGFKNITVVPYDELLTRLRNYITALSGVKTKRHKK